MLRTILGRTDRDQWQYPPVRGVGTVREVSDDPTADLAPAVAETHTSTLVFIGDRAYKLKRPLDLGFLDFRTREAREAACHREVELNRRLAPDVYLGVADVSGPDGEPWDHLVIMRRMPVGRRLSTLVEQGEDVADALADVAHQVAVLHAASPPAGAHAEVGSAATLRRHWDEVFALLRELGPTVVGPDRVDALESEVAAYLGGRDPLLDRRVADGHIVAGHGDLRAEDCFVLDDGVRILDCLDFDDDLMWGDALLDVAFLAMDLRDLGRPDLAEGFLARYAELAADRWPDSLAEHLVAYRASVRAKVAAVRVQQGHDEAAADVRRFVDLCAASLARGRVRLVLVGGSPGTGKSTLARALADRTGMVVLSSDEVRDDLEPSGGDGPTGVGEGRYAPEHRARVYDELRRRARELLGAGESVVLDASWSDADERDAARAVAAETSSALAEVRCTLPADEAAARIRARAAEGTDASEATPEVAAAVAASFAPWPEAAEVVTTDPPEVLAAAVLEDV